MQSLGVLGDRAHGLERRVEIDPGLAVGRVLPVVRGAVAARFALRVAAAPLVRASAAYARESYGDSAPRSRVAGVPARVLHARLRSNVRSARTFEVVRPMHVQRALSRKENTMIASHRWITGSVAAFAISTLASQARAQESTASAPAPANPASTAGTTVGGHLGVAVPIVTIGNPKTTVIGSDFATIGITPGISVNLDEHWTIDFEFIALNELKKTPAPTTFVVDPGVVRHFGSVAVGLRVATQVGALTNVGLVPILVVPFKVSNQFSYFVEGDIPLFLRDDGTKMQPSASFLFQTGVGF